MEDWRARRHAEMRQRIVDAAWDAADEHGIATLTLRHLADRLGMQPPSLYEYVEGKDAVYDLLFADGYRDLDRHMDASLEAVRSEGLARPDALLRALDDYLAFCRARPARYRLMFTHAVPGWQPGEDAYQASLDSWMKMQKGLAELGVTRSEHVDLYVALSAGLAAQQDANDLGGDRYAPLARSAIEMFVAHIDRESNR